MVKPMSDDHPPNLRAAEEDFRWAEVALRHAGLHGVPMINVENACASSTSAFQLACMAISAGTAEEYTSSTPSPAGRFSARWPTPISKST